MNGQDDMFVPGEGDVLDLIERSGSLIPRPERWPELLAELFAVHEALNLRRGMTATEAAVDARDRCLLEAQYLGGKQTYFPTGETLTAALRDALIFREFKGHNQRTLARKYKLTETRIYQIIAEQTALFVKERQGKLFNV